MKHSIDIKGYLLTGLLLVSQSRVMGFYPPYHTNCRSAIAHYSHIKTPEITGFLFEHTSLKHVAEAKKYRLFKILRNKDANEISYDVNLDINGKLVQSNPIDIYWVKYANGGKKEQLNNIQRKYAYGICFTSLTRYQAVFRFVSYEKRTFTLKKDSQGTYKVYVKSLGKEVELSRIFIHIEGGTFWFPNISRVDLHGKDQSTGSNTIETIKP